MCFHRLVSFWSPKEYARICRSTGCRKCTCPGKKTRIIRYHRLPPRLYSIFPSSGLLRGVRWFETDVSGLPISVIFNDQIVWKWDPWVVPKRRFQTTSRRVRTQKTEEFRSTAADAQDMVSMDIVVQATHRWQHCLWSLSGYADWSRPESNSLSAPSPQHYHGPQVVLLSSLRGVWEVAAARDVSAERDTTTPPYLTVNTLCLCYKEKVISAGQGIEVSSNVWNAEYCGKAWLRTGVGAHSWCTRWFKYDRDDLCVNKSQFVPVIFEPPCNYIFYTFIYSIIFLSTQQIILECFCQIWKIQLLKILVNICRR